MSKPEKMTCVWCDGDTELHQKLFEHLLLFDKKKDNENDCERAFADLSRALTDFYHCLDCINVYHRVKLVHVQTEDEFQALWEKVEKSRLCDIILKAKDKIDEDVEFIHLPISEILQNPYIFCDEEISYELATFIEKLHAASQKIPWDFDLDYPGVFLLLISKSEQVRDWALQVLKEFPEVSTENSHKYVNVVNCLFYLISYQQQTGGACVPVFPGLLPDKLPTFLYSADPRVLFMAYNEMLRFLPSRLLRTALSNHVNRDFFTCLVQKMKESKRLFWSGVVVITSFLQKLDSSFWLLSNAFSAPNQLYFLIKSNSHYLRAQDEARKSKFSEQSINDTDIFISQFTTQSFSEIFNDVTKASKSPFLFSWMLPLLKTLLEFTDHFESLAKSIIACLLQTIDECVPTSDLCICGFSCFLCMIEYLIGMGSLHLLNDMSAQVVGVLITVAQLDTTYEPSLSAIYAKLKTTTQNMVTKFVSKSVGTKQINDNDYVRFKINWNKMLKDGKDYDIKVIERTLYNLFKKVNIKTEETDDKRAIQEQIKLQESLDSNEVICIESDNEEESSSVNTQGVIHISDSDSAEENIIEHKEDDDVKGNFPLVFSGSQSPIRISDDENNEDLMVTNEELMTDDKSVTKYDKYFHGEYHFSIDNTSSDQDNEHSMSVEDSITDEEVQKQSPKKPLFSLSSLKEKVGGTLDREKLIKNKEMTRKRVTSQKNDEPKPSNDTEEKTTDNSIYENQLFDITSNFQKSAQQEGPPPPKKKKPTVKIASRGGLRRERLEKDLCSPTTAHPPTTKNKTGSMSGPAVHYPPPSLPVVTSKRKYNMDLFYSSILMWDPIWLDQERDELDISAKLSGVPFSYNSFDEYVKINWPLMMLETWAQLRRDWEEYRENSPRKAYQIESFVDKPSSRVSNLKCKYIEPATTSNPAHSSNIFNQDLVFLSFNEGELQLFGIIDSVEKGFYKNRKLKVYTLNITTRNSTGSNYMRSVIITRITSLTTVLRQWHALINFQNSLLCGDILKPFRSQTYTTRDTLIKRTDRLMKLNPDQFQAVSAATKAVTSPFTIPRICLIQGPPGTGKSYTVKTIITHLMQELGKEKLAEDTGNNRKTAQAKLKNRNRILVCAPSNAAVDEIVKRLLNSPPRLVRPNAGERNISNNCGDFNLIRIGRHMESALRHCSLEYLVDKRMQDIKFKHNPDAIQREIKKLTHILEDLDRTCVKLKMSADPKKKIEEYHKKMKERENLQQNYDELNKQLSVATARVDLYQERKRSIQNLLLHADIVCCTLSGAGSEWMVKTFQKGTAFRCVLVDEAGQCCEPDILVPLQFGTSKLILVGDQNQLPATVLSQKAMRYNFGQSLFERTIHALNQYRTQFVDASKVERAAFMLTTQYRMTREICSFPSKRFYENKLCPAKQLLREKPWSLRAYMVINIKTANERKSASGSLHNPVERDYVLELCKAITGRTSIKEQEIGIITPYRQQASMIKEVFRKNKLQTVTVNTIDGYQGQEKNVIILSCVRGPNQKNTIGFLSHPQRMNVALTRAKKTLVVLSNQAVQVDDDWKELFSDAEERNLLFNIDSTQDAVKCLLKEPFGNQQPKPSAATAKQRQQRGVKFLEDAPMPPRPVDPRRKVGGVSYLSSKDIDQTQDDVLLQADDGIICFLPHPSITKDDNQESSSSSVSSIHLPVNVPRNDDCNNPVEYVDNINGIDPREQGGCGYIDTTEMTLVSQIQQLQTTDLEEKLVDDQSAQHNENNQEYTEEGGFDNIRIDDSIQLNNLKQLSPVDLSDELSNEKPESTSLHIIRQDNKQEDRGENGTSSDNLQNQYVDDFADSKNFEHGTIDGASKDHIAMESKIREITTQKIFDSHIIKGQNADDFIDWKKAKLDKDDVLNKDRDIAVQKVFESHNDNGYVDGPNKDREIAIQEKDRDFTMQNFDRQNYHGKFDGMDRDNDIVMQMTFDDHINSNNASNDALELELNNLKLKLLSQDDLSEETAYVKCEAPATADTRKDDVNLKIVDMSISSRSDDASLKADNEFELNPVDPLHQTDDNEEFDYDHELSWRYADLSEHEVIGNVAIRFISEASVEKVAVESKFCRWRKKCYSNRHRYRSIYGDTTEDENYTKDDESYTEEDTGRGIISKRLSKKRHFESTSESDYTSNLESTEFSGYDDISEETESEESSTEVGGNKENQNYDHVISTQPFVCLNKLDINMDKKYILEGQCPKKKKQPKQKKVRFHGFAEPKIEISNIDQEYPVRVRSKLAMKAKGKQSVANSAVKKKGNLSLKEGPADNFPENIKDHLFRTTDRTVHKLDKTFVEANFMKRNDGLKLTSKKHCLDSKKNRNIDLKPCVQKYVGKKEKNDTNRVMQKQRIKSIDEKQCMLPISTTNKLLPTAKKRPLSLSKTIHRSQEMLQPTNFEKKPYQKLLDQKPHDQKPHDQKPHDQKPHDQKLLADNTLTKQDSKESQMKNSSFQRGSEDTGKLWRTGHIKSDSSMSLNRYSDQDKSCLIENFHLPKDTYYPAHLEMHKEVIKSASLPLAQPPITNKQYANTKKIPIKDSLICSTRYNDLQVKVNYESTNKLQLSNIKPTLMQGTNVIQNDTNNLEKTLIEKKMQIASINRSETGLMNSQRTPSEPIIDLHKKPDGIKRKMVSPKPILTKPIIDIRNRSDEVERKDASAPPTLTDRPMIDPWDGLDKINRNTMMCDQPTLTKPVIDLHDKQDEINRKTASAQATSTKSTIALLNKLDEIKKEASVQPILKEPINIISNKPDISRITIRTQPISTESIIARRDKQDEINRKTASAQATSIELMINLPETPVETNRNMISVEPTSSESIIDVLNKPVDIKRKAESPQPNLAEPTINKPDEIRRNIQQVSTEIINDLQQNKLTEMKNTTQQSAIKTIDDDQHASDHIKEISKSVDSPSENTKMTTNSILMDSIPAKQNEPEEILNVAERTSALINGQPVKPDRLPESKKVQNSDLDFSENKNPFHVDVVGQENSDSLTLLSPNAKTKKSFASYMAEKRKQKYESGGYDKEKIDDTTQREGVEEGLGHESDDLARFADAELERRIDEQIRVENKHQCVLKKKKEDYELSVNIKKEFQTTQNRQRHLVLFETIQKLRNLRNQQISPVSDIDYQRTSRFLSNTIPELGLSPADSRHSCDSGSTVSTRRKSVDSFDSHAISFEEFGLTKRRDSLDSMEFPLFSPVSEKPSADEKPSPAKSNTSADSGRTGHVKTKVKQSYLRLPHRHKDGSKCVSHCTRLPVASTKSNTDDHQPFSSVPHQHQAVCPDMINRRDAPSRSYFNFPHRHSDGTYCETVCSRVLERERLRGIEAPKPQPEQHPLQWKLIPLDLGKTNKLVDPRLLDRNTLDPRIHDSRESSHVASNQVASMIVGNSNSMNRHRLEPRSEYSILSPTDSNSKQFSYVQPYTNYQQVNTEDPHLQSQNLLEPADMSSRTRKLEEHQRKHSYYLESPVSNIDYDSTVHSRMTPPSQTIINGSSQYCSFSLSEQPTYDSQYTTPQSSDICLEGRFPDERETGKNSPTFTRNNIYTQYANHSHDIDLPENEQLDQQTLENTAFVRRFSDERKREKDSHTFTWNDTYKYQYTNHSHDTNHPNNEQWDQQTLKNTAFEGRCPDERDTMKEIHTFKKDDFYTEKPSTSLKSYQLQKDSAKANTYQEVSGLEAVDQHGNVPMEICTPSDNECDREESAFDDDVGATTADTPEGEQEDTPDDFEKDVKPVCKFVPTVILKKMNPLPVTQNDSVDTSELDVSYSSEDVRLLKGSIRNGKEPRITLTPERDGNLAERNFEFVRSQLQGCCEGASNLKTPGLLREESVKDNDTCSENILCKPESTAIFSDEESNVYEGDYKDGEQDLEPLECMTGSDEKKSCVDVEKWSKGIASCFDLNNNVKKPSEPHAKPSTVPISPGTAERDSSYSEMQTYSISENLKEAFQKEIHKTYIKSIVKQNVKGDESRRNFLTRPSNSHPDAFRYPNSPPNHFNSYHVDSPYQQFESRHVNAPHQFTPNLLNTSNPVTSNHVNSPIQFPQNHIISPTQFASNYVYSPNQFTTDPFNSSNQPTSNRVYSPDQFTSNSVNPSNLFTSPPPYANSSLPFYEYQRPLHSLNSPGYKNAYAQSSQDKKQSSPTMMQGALSIFSFSNSPNDRGVASQCYSGFQKKKLRFQYEPSLPISTKIEQNESDLLDHVISRSLDAHAPEYFNEGLVEEEKSYLLEFTKGFAAGLLEKHEVRNEEMFISLIDTATKNALDTVLKMKKQDDGKPLGELIPLQVDEEVLEGILSGVGSNMPIGRSEYESNAIGRMQVKSDSIGQAECESNSIGQEDYKFNAIYRAECKSKSVDRLERESISISQVKYASISIGQIKNESNSIETCEHSNEENSLVSKWKPVVSVVSPVDDAKLPVQKKSAKSKNKRKKTLRRSDASGSGHVQKIDIRLEIDKKRKVYCEERPRESRKVERPRRVEQRSVIYPPDLTSFKLSLEDIEKLNQMNASPPEKRFMSKRKHRDVEEDNGRLCYDVTDERIEEIRRSASTPSLKSKKSRHDDDEKPEKVSPDLREKIEMLKNKRTKKKRGGFHWL